MIRQVIRSCGKARDVSPAIAQLAKEQGNKTLGELEDELHKG